MEAEAVEAVEAVEDEFLRSVAFFLPMFYLLPKNEKYSLPVPEIQKFKP